MDLFFLLDQQDLIDEYHLESENAYALSLSTSLCISRRVRF